MHELDVQQRCEHPRVFDRIDALGGFTEAVQVNAAAQLGLPRGGHVSACAHTAERARSRNCSS
jgi:hypothetical protein